MWEYKLIPHQQGLDVGIRSQDYMREYVMCICDTVLWSILCTWFQMSLRCDYICIKWFHYIFWNNYFWYHWMSLWKIKILVLCLTLFRCVFCIITYKMCGSPHQLLFFRLKCCGEYRTVELICKVQGRAGKL